MLSLLPQSLKKLGKTLLHLLATNGYVGLNLQRNQRHGVIGWNELVVDLWKESEDLAAGQGVRIGE